MKRSQLLTILVTAILSGGGVLLASYLTGSSRSSRNDAVTASIDALNDDPKSGEMLVTLTAEQLASLNLASEPAAVCSLASTVTISGRLDYDQNRHVAIKSACDGIVTDVRVRPGDRVAAGEVVATLSSPDVGLARSELRKRDADVRLAQNEYDRQGKITAGVEKMVKLIRDNMSPESIAEEVADESLGAYRSSLLGAYTQSRLARQVAESSRGAASSGAIPGRVQLERDADVRTKAADIEALAEKSLFDAQRMLRESEAALANAGRLRDVSQQRIRTLLGPASTPGASDTSEHVESAALSQVDLVAAIDGTIEEQLLASSERVIAGESVFTIADTSRLWAIGDVREGDWSAITAKVGDSVQLATPAISGFDFTGEIILLPRWVDPTTGAARLVARITAADLRLRPGLFIRMTVPAGQSRECLSVPESAVVVHEDQHFVFVPESESSFRRVDVSIGQTTSERIEIKSGLQVGTTVVSGGVFQLKSSLLLAGEEE